jgi:hypothetical protein
VEVGLLARLHGIPVVSMVLPGKRTDPPHQLAHQIAESLIAAWPRELYDPSWLRPFAGKTRFVGGIGRFTDRAPCRSGRPRILVLGGAGGSAFTSARILACAEHYRSLMRRGPCGRSMPVSLRLRPPAPLTRPRRRQIGLRDGHGRRGQIDAESAANFARTQPALVYQ